MAATQKANAPSDASDGWVLDVDLFDRLLARKGITTVVDQAAKLGVHRSTMFRWRGGDTSMGITDAMRLADLAGTTVDKLFRRSHPRPTPPPPPGPPNPPRREEVA